MWVAACIDWLAHAVDVVDCLLRVVSCVGTFLVYVVVEIRERAVFVAHAHSLRFPQFCTVSGYPVITIAS